MAKRKEIRNSTAEFLIFQIEGKEQGIEVYYKDKTVWCTQKAMGMLFDCTSDNISVHLQNIYDTDELKREATTEKISVVRREGNRDVNRTLQFYCDTRDRYSVFLIYQDENGIARVNVRFEGEDVWLNVEQMMELFDDSQQDISYHINQIYAENEQDPERTHKKILLVRQEETEAYAEA